MPRTALRPLGFEYHCGTHGDHDAADFFCPASPVHITRLIPHRSSQVS